MNEDELIIYPCKITGGRHAELRLPPELSAADVRRIHAFLLTQVDDDQVVPRVLDNVGPGRRPKYQILYQGRQLSVEEAAAVTGISADTIHCRIKRGWPADRILEPPTFVRLHADSKPEAVEDTRDDRRIEIGAPPPAPRSIPLQPGERIPDAILRMMRSGMTSQQVAETLDLNRWVVGRHLGLLRRQGLLDPSSTDAAPPTAAPAITPGMQRVCELLNAGKSVEETAAESGKTCSTVRKYLSHLRTAGLLNANVSPEPDLRKHDHAEPAASLEAEPEPEVEEDDEPEDEPEPEESREPIVVSPETAQRQGGASVDELREDVRKQCQRSGKPCGPATLMTTLGGRVKHAHRAKVSLIGDGTTDPDDSGHVHAIRGFKVRLAHGHDHGLATAYAE